MQLQITDRIPYGNVCAVETVTEAAVNVVRFAAAAHGGIERLWFCFRIDNPSPETLPAETRIEMKHVTSMLGNSRDGIPVIRYDGGEWTRLSAGTEVMRTDGHRSLFWNIATPGTYAEIAWCYPYGEAEIDTLIGDCHGFWNNNEIGVSQNGNAIKRLSNSYGEKNSTTPGIYITARQHSAEVSGSWVLDGFLRRMANAGAEAPLIWCVPLTNIDGILAGDYGKNPYPHDLNRAWDPRAPMRHETKLFMADQNIWKDRCAPALFLDFHSPSMGEKDIYCFTSKTAAEHFPLLAPLINELKSRLIPFGSTDFERHADYKPFDVWGQHQNATEHAENDLHIPAISFETSYYMAGNKIMTIPDYRHAGTLIAEAVLAAVR
ncbi:MAG: succinylglutamate desuccinylase/aspartoacylase family protein [Spirochaetes bacterium]|nr:succinylglutamate desuccinylase/aspartoacylase family protein [Spirochaetota bacterium]